MQVNEYTTHSPKETKQLAELFARELMTSDVARKGALVVALEGDLGGGKTTFTQGFACGLGVRKKVLSPTFVIMRHHNIRKSDFHMFIHMDAYRIENIKELRALGWQDILKDREAIVLVEWANRIHRALPKNYIQVKFRFIRENMRDISMSVKLKAKSVKQQLKT